MVPHRQSKIAASPTQPVTIPPCHDSQFSSSSPSSLSLAPRSLPTTQPSSPFTIVLIDKSDLSVLGPFPFDRSVFADAVIRAANRSRPRRRPQIFLRSSPALTTATTLSPMQCRTPESPPRSPSRRHLDAQSQRSPRAAHIAHSSSPPTICRTRSRPPPAGCPSHLLPRAPPISALPIPRLVPAASLRSSRYRDHYVKSLWTCFRLRAGHQEPGQHHPRKIPSTSPAKPSLSTRTACSPPARTRTY